MKLLLIIFIFTSAINASEFTCGTSRISVLSETEDSLSKSSYGNLENTQREINIKNPFYFDSPNFWYDEYLYSEIHKYNLSNDIFDNNINNIYEDQSFLKSKLNLSKAMKTQLSFIKQNEMGTFGKILGGAVGISAMGLGIYHLIKYKDEYFK